MSDPHQVVVDYISKMVCWEAVALDDNEIVLRLRLFPSTVDDIVDFNRFDTALESNSVRVSSGRSLG